MRNREELEKRADEAIIKDRIQFKDAYRKKARQKAKILLKRKKYELENTKWKIKQQYAKILVLPFF